MLGWPGRRVCPGKCMTRQRSRTLTTTKAFYPMILLILVILFHETVLSLSAFLGTFPVLLPSQRKEWRKQASHCTLRRITYRIFEKFL